MLAIKEAREKARESIFRHCYDYALTRRKSLDTELDVP